LKLQDDGGVKKARAGRPFASDGLNHGTTEPHRKKERAREPASGGNSRKAAAVAGQCPCSGGLLAGCLFSPRRPTVWDVRL